MEFLASYQLYDILVHFEALIIFLFSASFLVLFLRSDDYQHRIWEKNFQQPGFMQIKMLFLILLPGLFLGTLVIAPSWWNASPILCLCLICLFGCIFIHDSFPLAMFILLLFLRPWELLEARNHLEFILDPKTALFTDTSLVSLPKICFFTLLGTFVLGKIIRKPQIGSFKWTIDDSGICFFLIWMLLPILLRGQSAALALYFDNLFRAGIIYFSIRWSYKSEFNYSILKKTFFFVGVFLIFSSLLYSFLLSDVLESEGRVEAFGLFKNSNDLGSLIVLCFPFLMSSFKNVYLQTMVTLLSTLAIYSTQSRGAFLGLVVSICVLIYSRLNIRFSSFNKKKLVPLVVGLSFSFLIYLNILDRSASDIETSTLSRLNYWIAAVRMAITSPIWGLGFGSYEANFEKFAVQILEYGNRTAHSSFFLVLAEGGLIGIIIYAFIIQRGILNAFKLKQKRPELLSSLLGYGVTTLFLSHSYLFFIYLLLAIIRCLHEKEEYPLSQIKFN